MFKISPVFTGNTALLEPKRAEINNKNANSLTFRSSKSLNLANQALSNYNKAFISFRGTESQKPQVTYDLIKEMTGNPRDGYNKLKELETQLGSEYYQWKYNEYEKGFAEFTARMFNEAKSIDELIKFRPDWTGAKLREKFNEHHPGEPVRFGKIPEALGNKDTFDQLATVLARTILEQHNNTFSKEYDIPDQTINGKTFKIKSLCGGKTSKVPFLIETQEGNKFIVKIDPKPFTGSEKFDSVDSVALQAVIDYYLTLNDCQNSSKVFYFDEKHNASIYEFVDKDQDQSEIRRLKSTYSGFGNKLQDLGALGVRFNDTMGDGNIFIRNGNFIMVDNGHCTFDNPLKPKVSNYHKELPNTLQFSCFLK